MSRIFFSCPYCGARLTFGRSMGGTITECPECKESVTVPDPGHSSDEE